MPAKRRKGKQGGSQAVTTPSSPTRVSDKDPRRTPSSPSKEPPLVLTSDKRRGVYECDYCHADISQVPRIRCAVCPDFDLCLDCFANTDHSVAVSRIRAGASGHGTVREGSTPGTSASAISHSGAHKYRVADSTRYPLFPSARAISKEVGSESMDIDDLDDAEGEEKNDEELKQMEPNNQIKDKPKDSIAEVEMTDTENPNDTEVGFVVQDDRRTLWTVEEDLRLLDAISTCGLGNWTDIAEAISGQGSSSKTPRRCMERYFDDFLGRYGHVLPAYTIIEDEDGQETGEDDRVAGDGESEPKKRRMERMSSFGVAGLATGRRGKKLKVVTTSSLPGYDKVWSNPYLPPIPGVQVGQEVGRDHRYRAEQVFVKLISNAESVEEADRIRKEWTETRLNEPNGPTVLPMRPDDLATLPGSDLAGFMPRRGDFDMEWDNDAENILADMEFTAGDSAQDRELKIKVIQIYNSKLDERDRRKNFLLSRGLLDYRKNQQADAMLPRDERDLVRRMRLFERLHTPEEHRLFIDDLLKAKRLRKEIAQLQMYRRMGIETLAEAEKYENDKTRREIHKMAYLQKEAEAGKTDVAKSRPTKDAPPGLVQDEDDTDQLNKATKVGKWQGFLKVVATTSGPVVSDCALNEITKNLNPDTEKADPTDAPFLVSHATVTAPLNNNAVEKSILPEAGGQEFHAAAANDAAASTINDETGSTFAIAGMSGYDLLTRKEADLCRKLQLKPRQYLKVKKAIIQESFRMGLLDKESSPNHTVVTIDVIKRGEVVDFMVRAGWISSKVGDTLKQ
ncbi:Zinc-binding domain [Fragilaria crotonensis]|nr:Zinc-binding domain [Fragilaria crotonensis]